MLATVCSGVSPTPWNVSSPLHFVPNITRLLLADPDGILVPDVQQHFRGNIDWHSKLGSLRPT